MSIFLPAPLSEDPSMWFISSSDDLAQEEAEYEEKMKEIRESNEGFVIGKTTLENDPEEYDQDGEDDDADNVEEESDPEEFEQETV